MTLVLPHTFHDGVGETASGVQVMDNLNTLKGAIEGLESGGPGPGVRTERSFGVPITPSLTGATFVTGDLQLSPAPGFGAVASVFVAGVKVAELFAHESIAHPIRMALPGLWVPAGATYEVVNGTHAESLFTTHTPIG